MSWVRPSQGRFFVWIRSEGRQRSNGGYEGDSMSRKDNVLRKDQSAQCAPEARSLSAIEDAEDTKIAQVGEEG